MVRVVLEDGRELDCSARAAVHRHAAEHRRGSGWRRPASSWASAARCHATSSVRTNVPHIYACGDVTGQIMLANTAAMHGRTAAMQAAGVATEPISYTGVAWCVFTRPEIAKAGISERAGADQPGRRCRSRST